MPKVLNTEVVKLKIWKEFSKKFETLTLD